MTTNINHNLSHVNLEWAKWIDSDEGQASLVNPFSSVTSAEDTHEVDHSLPSLMSLNTAGNDTSTMSQAGGFQVQPPAETEGVQVPRDSPDPVVVTIRSPGLSTPVFFGGSENMMPGKCEQCGGHFDVLDSGDYRYCPPCASMYGWDQGMPASVGEYRYPDRPLDNDTLPEMQTFPVREAEIPYLRGSTGESSTPGTGPEDPDQQDQQPVEDRQHTVLPEAAMPEGLLDDAPGPVPGVEILEDQADQSDNHQNGPSSLDAHLVGRQEQSASKDRLTGPDYVAAADNANQPRTWSHLATRSSERTLATPLSPESTDRTMQHPRAAGTRSNFAPRQTHRSEVPGTVVESIENRSDPSSRPIHDVYSHGSGISQGPFDVPPELAAPTQGHTGYSNTFEPSHAGQQGTQRQTMHGNHQLPNISPFPQQPVFPAMPDQRRQRLPHPDSFRSRTPIARGGRHRTLNVKCADCGRLFPPNDKNNHVHCTQCCNGAADEGQDWWAIVGLEMSKAARGRWNAAMLMHRSGSDLALEG